MGFVRLWVELVGILAGGWAGVVRQRGLGLDVDGLGWGPTLVFTASSKRPMWSLLKNQPGFVSLKRVNGFWFFNPDPHLVEFCKSLSLVAVLHPIYTL